ncbi:MAG TPA: hypothetical protein VM598_06565 [Bdellovibrionota bacterium]|nr:hypothetical protein [Bdellovibrionota bacterium]
MKAHSSCMDLQVEIVVHKDHAKASKKTSLKKGRKVCPDQTVGIVRKPNVSEAMIPMTLEGTGSGELPQSVELKKGERLSLNCPAMLQMHDGSDCLIRAKGKLLVVDVTSLPGWNPRAGKPEQIREISPGSKVEVWTRFLSESGKELGWQLFEVFEGMPD